MDKNKDFLGTEPIGRLMFRLAVPSVIAQLVNLLYNMVDRIYIGKYDPTGLAITGVGICLPIITMISAFAALVGYGGSPQASILLGRQETEKAEKTMGNCLTCLLAVGAALTVILLFSAHGILMRFGASADTIGYATDYIRIYLLGTVFVQLALGMNSFISAQGFTTASMISVLIGAALNIVLDPVFIFALDMGVRGAALATVISQTVSAIWVIGFLCSRKAVMRIKLENLKLSGKIILPCLALGLSPFVMQFTESILNICFNTSLQKYGGDIAVGSITVLTTIMQFCLLPLSGFTQGAQPVTSYNFGAGKYDRVRKSFRLLIITCMSYSLLLWLMIELFPGAFIRLFNNGNPELVSYASRMLRLFCCVLFLMGAQIACQQTLIAVGNAKTSIFLAILRKIILLIPFIYIFPCFVSENAAKAVAVFCAEPAADFAAVTTTVILFSKQFKKALGDTEA